MVTMAKTGHHFFEEKIECHHQLLHRVTPKNTRFMWTPKRMITRCGDKKP